MRIEIDTTDISEEELKVNIVVLLAMLKAVQKEAARKEAEEAPVRARLDKAMQEAERLATERGERSRAQARTEGEGE